MNLFFASDLHGSLPCTERVLTEFRASGATHLVLLGDILNHGPRNPVPEGYNPPAVAERLNALAENIIAVRGNCDSEVDQMLLSFPMMADYTIILLPTGNRVFVTHGHLYNADKLPPLSRGDVLAHGHSHIPQADWQGDHIIFNPSSVTFPRNGHPASYGQLIEGTLSVTSFDGKRLAECQVTGK